MLTGMLVGVFDLHRTVFFRVGVHYSVLSLEECFEDFVRCNVER